jgi:exopolysaccharide biosynthesis protein
MKIFPAIMWLFVAIVLASVHASPASSWNCTLQKKVQVSAAVLYRQLLCSGRGTDGDWAAGPIIMYTVESNLSAVVAAPMVANETAQLETLSEMISHLPSEPAVAINGGYFWEVNRKEFLDDVCFGKLREDALQPASLTHVNHGIGDTFVRINGTLKSCNCDLFGFSHPSVLILNGTGSTVKKLKRGEQLSESEGPNAIANSPNLVTDGVFDIPSLDWGLNRWEHSANAAVALSGGNGNGKKLHFVVSDGFDGCPKTNTTCGMEAKPMAHFLVDYLGVTDAFELDQGGSATLFIRGLGVVNSNRGRERRIFSGIYVK